MNINPKIMSHAHKHHIDHFFEFSDALLASSYSPLEYNESTFTDSIKANNPKGKHIDIQIIDLYNVFFYKYALF